MDDVRKQRYLNGVQAEINRLAALIDVPVTQLPTLERTEGGKWLSVDWHDADDGDDEDGWRLTLFCNESGYDWTLAEVGIGYEDYLLYVLFDQIVAEIAIKQIAAVDRPTNKEAWFSLHESLLTRLNTEWGAKAAKAHNRFRTHNDHL